MVHFTVGTKFTCATELKNSFPLMLLPAHFDRLSVLPHAEFFQVA